MTTATRTCHNCGSEHVESKSGDYYFPVPPHAKGNPVKLECSEWLECENCGEQLLPSALSQRIETAAIERGWMN